MFAKAVDYVKSFKNPAQFDGGDTREVTFPVGPSNSMTMKGQQYLVNFAFPNFYFHAATAHGILRHNGVEIGKRDFIGGEVIVVSATKPVRARGCRGPAGHISRQSSHREK